MFFKRYKERLAKQAEQKAIAKVEKEKAREAAEVKRIAEKKKREKMDWVESVLATRRFNYVGDVALDKIINEMLLKKIVNVDTSSESHYVIVETSDGYKYKLWNANKYYGWLCRGNITLGGKVLVDWDDEQPHPETIATVKERLSPINNNSYYHTKNPKVNISEEFELIETKSQNIEKLIKKL